MSIIETREYRRGDCAVFRKTHEEFGALSNMAAGFPLIVNGVKIRTAEALYQACRFPHLSAVQQEIIVQASPMAAKMVGKPYHADSRQDWDDVRVTIMRWVLRVKLAQHWEIFSELLLRTGDQPIVEESRRDDFWGAKPVEPDVLIGRNVLGRLLMELRAMRRGSDMETLRFVPPPRIPSFKLYGRTIDTIDTTSTHNFQSAEPTSEGRSADQQLTFEISPDRLTREKNV